MGYTPDSGNQRPMTLNRLNPETGTIDVSAEIGVRGTSIAAGAGAIWLLRSEGTLLRFDLEPAPAHPDPEALRPFVAPFVAGLMEARIEGSGAESFLSSEGLEAWSSNTSGLRPLYSPEGLRYESFAIVSVDSPGEGAFEVGVRMFGAHLDGQDEWFQSRSSRRRSSSAPGGTVTGSLGSCWSPVPVRGWVVPDPKDTRHLSLAGGLPARPGGPKMTSVGISRKTGSPTAPGVTVSRHSQVTLTPMVHQGGRRSTGRGSGEQG